MNKLSYIAETISDAIALLENEMECIECLELEEEYQNVVNKLKKALQISKELLYFELTVLQRSMFLELLIILILLSTIQDILL